MTIEHERFMRVALEEAARGLAEGNMGCGALIVHDGVIVARAHNEATSLADVTAHESRAKSLGLVGAAFGIGFILGPVIGGLLGHYDIRLPFLVAAGLCALNFLYGAVVVPESLPLEKRKTISLGRVNPLAALFGLTRLHNVGLLVAVIALNNLAQFILHVTWVLYTEFRFGWGPRETGLSLFVVGIAATLVQGVLLGTMLRKLGEQRTVLCGLLSGVLAYAGYGLATQGWMMYAIIFANFLSYAVGPAMVAIVSKAADPREQGLVMGTLASLASLMVVIAPLIGTPLLAEVSQLPATDWRVGLPYLLSSALNLAALAMAALYFARHRQMRPLQDRRRAPALQAMVCGGQKATGEGRRVEPGGGGHPRRQRRPYSHHPRKLPHHLPAMDGEHL